jgi:chromate reductase, NAD(P)H dehydrogenase (quinone)
MSEVLILVASSGMNVQLGDKLADEVKLQGGSTEVINLVEANLPLFPAESTIAKQKSIELTGKIRQAKSLIVVAPEYNGSTPPVWSNALAWISTATEDWRESFNSKSVAIATHSGGDGAQVLMALRNQLAYIGANVLGRQLLTHYKKPLNPESATAVIEQLLKLATLEA